MFPIGFVDSKKARIDFDSSLRVSSEIQDDTAIVSHYLPSMKEEWRAVNKGYQKRIRRSQFHGWQMGVLAGSLTSAFVLICNITIVIIGQRHSGYDKSGVATLFRGNEESVARFNTGAHIVINVLSTLLLSASNYTMQVLNSPTRHDIDRAHAKGKWYDIGLLSLHNMINMPTKRIVLCLILGISSTPLHLLYGFPIALTSFEANTLQLQCFRL